MRKPRIVVVGSTNTDLTVAADRLPLPGETVLGGRLVVAGGGKGANQAVAAARAGAHVAFVAKVGADEFGRATLAGLKREGINTDCVGVVEQTASGLALIIVDKKGENLIAVASGANACLWPVDVRRAKALIEAADLVLLQLEVPARTVAAAVRSAQKAGVRVLLNPAPAPPAKALAGLLNGLDYLTPNMGEAARLLGTGVGGRPEAMARRLVRAGVGAVFLTLGARGVCVCDGRECTLMRPPRVRAVDTVGAGDCFSGALAVALAEGKPPREAALFATCAAALSVQKAGAQPSLPRRRAIDQLLAKHKQR